MFARVFRMMQPVRSEKDLDERELALDEDRKTVVEGIATFSFDVVPSYCEVCFSSLVPRSAEVLVCCIHRIGSTSDPLFLPFPLLCLQEVKNKLQAKDYKVSIVSEVLNQTLR